uniref:Uncharacterized protein n=1 Tax=Oryza meridionalis TaxID=40149 RepID=A0A0E0D313_9ORYZ
MAPGRTTAPSMSASTAPGTNVGAAAVVPRRVFPAGCLPWATTLSGTSSAPMAGASSSLAPPGSASSC